MSTEAQKETVIPPEYLLDPADPANQTPDPVTQQAPNPEDDIPEKLRGKSPAELVKLYRESESELGRARNEIGHVRRLADELLGINRAGAARPVADNPAPRKPLTTDDLWQDPEKAVTAVVRQEAETREAATSERVARLEYDLNLSRFELKHPDYKGTMQKPEFVEWMQKSPLRAGLAHQAAVQGNFAAADELLLLYKESHPAAPAAPAAPDPTEQARNAGLTRSGGSGSGSGGPAPTSRQIWSRAKLLDMRINNPEEFDRLSPEINRAYAEKRVR